MRFWLRNKVDVEKKLSEKEEEPISFVKLIIYSDWNDKLLMMAGTVTAIASGILFPICFLMYGKMAGTFIQYEIKRDIEMNPNNYYDHNHTNTTLTKNCLKMKILKQRLDYDYDSIVGYTMSVFASIGVLSVLLNYLSHVCWNLAGERQIRRIRFKFFESVIRQDIAFFDHKSPGELTAIMNGNIDLFKMGINFKVADFVYFLCRGIACLTLGLMVAWKFAIVFLILIPLMIVSSSILATTIKKYSSQELKSYECAGRLAHEALSSLRSVISLGIQKVFIRKYSTSLVVAERMSIKKGLLSGLLDGLNNFLFNLCFVIGMWYGVYLTRVDCGNYGPSNVVTAFFSIMNTTFAFSQALPFLKDLAEAKAAAYKVFDIIETKSLIDTREEANSAGKKLDKLRGEIKFRKVSFSYPTRSSTTILKELNLDIESGKTVALVGSSGSGKSTIVSLLQRFYLPDSGSITIDDEKIENLDLNWLRSQMALVSQEPILFSISIKDNIRLGRLEATDEEIVEAAKQANAHTFIMSTPHQYETKVGERGAQLSGGQKQRIAIARALLRNPRIILLDEATSALDNESEKIVQEALEKVKIGRTTIVVAHRLSTIRNADLIVVLSDGQLKETGRHDELMQRKGAYFELHQNQTQKEARKPPPLKKSSSKSNLPKEQMTSSKATAVVSDIEQIKIMDQNQLVVAENKTVQVKRRRSILRRILAVRNIFKYEIKLLKMNWAEMIWILLGCGAQLLNGALLPLTSIIFSEIYKIFKIENRFDQNELTMRYMYFLFVIACSSFIAVVSNYYSFGLSGARLTKRIRVKMFESMMRQEMAFHDLDENRPSVLSTKLSSSAPYCKGISGEKIGLWCQALGGIGLALIFSFTMNWQLTVLMLLIVPFIFVSAVLAGKFSPNPTTQNGKYADDEGCRLATEAIENIRTIISMGREDYFLNEFRTIFGQNVLRQHVRLHLQAYFYSLSNNIFYFVQLCAFSYGFFLIKNEELTSDNLFRIYSSITMSALRLGRVYAQLPDQRKSKAAAKDAFKLIERKSRIDSLSEFGLRPVKLVGNIRFENVHFQYPNRQDVKILNGFNLLVKNGQTNALVGPSGCGKSTTIALLLRFYDVDRGAIYLDDYDIRSLNIGWLRSKIGLVSQEPSLFNTTIYENICYGDIDRSEIPMHEILMAAAQANIQNKIENLPLKYDTIVGNKGSQLSGGEKQRIAIARALIRKPQILLLDEATSALDNQSEKIVQDALDKVKQGRTCIIIAHRLSTIENSSNKISVVKDGQVVEEGSHPDLMKSKGVYYNLQKQ